MIRFLRFLIERNILYRRLIFVLKKEKEEEWPEEMNGRSIVVHVMRVGNRLFQCILIILDIRYMIGKYDIQINGMQWNMEEITISQKRFLRISSD